VAKSRKSDEGAAAERAAASADLESALVAGDSARTVKARERLRQANADYADRLVDQTRAERRAFPDFESLLSDPSLQVDPQAAVLASIVAYAAAEPATVSVPTRRAVFGMSEWFEWSVHEAGAVHSYGRATAQAVTSGR
jgi:hypothetical protein